MHSDNAKASSWPVEASSVEFIFNLIIVVI